jgi:hypothetical protein
MKTYPLRGAAILVFPSDGFFNQGRKMTKRHPAGGTLPEASRRRRQSIRGFTIILESGPIRLNQLDTGGYRSIQVDTGGKSAINPIFPTLIFYIVIIFYNFGGSLFPPFQGKLFG